MKLVKEKERDDTALAEAAVQALEGNASVPHEKIRVTLEEGRVTLAGLLRWQFQRSAASEAVRAMNDFDLDRLIETPLCSEELGIDLQSGSDEELFKWFLAGVLFGARISETIARNTHRAFEEQDLLDPQAIPDAGREVLVGTVMAEGGYVRYDNQRSNQLREAAGLAHGIDSTIEPPTVRWCCSPPSAPGTENSDMSSRTTDFTAR